MFSSLPDNFVAQYSNLLKTHLDRKQNSFWGLLSYRAFRKQAPTADISHISGLLLVCY